MNKSQKQAIEFLKHHIKSNLDDNPKYQEQITVFEVESTSYGTYWVTVEVEMLGLSKTNLLRYFSNKRWFVSIGPRGKIEAVNYPASYSQFKGTKVFNHINIK